MSSISLISVFLLLLLSAFLIFHRSDNRQANIFFAGFLLIMSLDLSGHFMGDVYREYSILNKLRLSIDFLKMPFLYFYIQKVCFKDFGLAKRHLIHTIPAIITAVILSVSTISMQLEVIYVITLQIQYYAYLAAIFIVLRKYRKIHFRNYSLQSETYNWLMAITVLFFIGNTVLLSRGIYEVMNDFRPLPWLNFGFAIFILGAVSWFVLKTMFSPKLFTKVNVYSNTEYIDAEDDTHLTVNETRLNAYMTRHKPYLNETLTLQELASQTDIPVKQLSHLINKRFGKHFFDFINAYRIEDAKKLLSHDELTIQQIMYEVGFNSKSSFNTAFKKITSQTPSNFRKTKGFQ